MYCVDIYKRMMGQQHQVKNKTKSWLQCHFWGGTRKNKVQKMQDTNGPRIQRAAHHKIYNSSTQKLPYNSAR
jgi:hypothetical protein